MKSHCRTLLLLCLCIGMISACASLRAPATAAPTYTPYPTYTILPTYTPVLTKTPLPTPTSKFSLIAWDELNAFLAQDHTNWNTYVEGKYTCVNYALDLVSNAEERGINAWIVAVMFQDSDIGHAFVAFNTSDFGIVWIEPQSDYAYAAVEVGQLLCLRVNTSRCWDEGVVTEVHEHIDCDPDTHKCSW
jgi:hypothetical protein